MIHSITMTNTESLIVCEALEKFSRASRIKSDSEIALKLKDKINTKQNDDRAIAYAEQLNMKRCKKKGE